MTSINPKAEVTNYPVTNSPLGLNDLIIALEKQRQRREFSKKAGRAIAHCLEETGLIDDETLEFILGR